MPPRDSRPSLLVLGHDRPSHLSRTLLALKVLREFPNYRLFIVLDGNFPAVQEVVENSVSPELIAQSNPPANYAARHRIHYNLRVGLELAFSDPDTPYCVVLEDDIVVSRDFLPFIHSVMSTKRKDPFLRAINGFSSLKEPDYLGGHKFIRGNFGVGWGWALPRRTYRKMKTVLDRKGDFHWDTLVEPIMRTGYVINPVASLVLNIGLDGSGSHTGSRGDDELARALAKSFHACDEPDPRFNQVAAPFDWREDYVLLDALSPPLRLLTYAAGHCLRLLSFVKHISSQRGLGFLLKVEVPLRRLFTKKLLPRLGRHSQSRARDFIS